MKKENETQPGELSEAQIEGAVGGLIVQPPTTPKTGGIGGTPLSENQLSDVSGDQGG